MFRRKHAQRAVMLLMVLAVGFLWAADQGLRAAASDRAGRSAPPPEIADRAADLASAPAAPPTATSPQGTAKKGATAGQTTTVVDAAGRGHVRMKKITQAERQAAADRLKGVVTAAGGITGPISAMGVTAMPGAMATSTLLVGPNGQLLPDYSGTTPNYANSPVPTVSIVGVPSIAGNLTTADRAFATDYPVLQGALAPVLVILPAATLPAGNLVSFQTWNQTTLGGSPFPSEGNLFHAYVLRPTGIAGQYSVVYDSGQLTIPAPVNPAGELATFAVAGAVPVLAGDVIAFYGQGIPLDTGGANADILSYPVAAAPAAGSTITLGAPESPVFSTDRTYSFAATVEVGTTSITGGIRKFVDRLPGLTAAGANGLGQYIPVAVPDTTSYPGSDYYEIELGQYAERMHSDLPPTTLRGYRQTNTADPTVSQFHYLGPLIVAQKGRPVRVKFTNALPTGAAGNLFIPADATVMGAGPGSERQ